jgi:NADPH-dependent 2,4-dienoyl-CoA reductase/sulfur reductase-like enzyme/rhodanese-related sulfurtransferase
MTESRRILIVGGGAGGAACAARVRRLDEYARITIFERGPFVSYANCGLPYYVGNVIQKQKSLLVATPEDWHSDFNVEVRTRSEVVDIDRTAQVLSVEELETGHINRERYDALVLAPGARGPNLRLPGADLAGIFSLQTIPQSEQIREWIETRKPQRAVVVGAGFAGLEMAENLAKRGLKVTVLEMLPQVVPLLDPEMSEPVCRHLESHCVDVVLSEPVVGFEGDGEAVHQVRTEWGSAFPADLVFLAMGVQPDTSLARRAGLEIGASGGIHVDQSLRTSDPNIWAVGDAVQVTDVVTGMQRVVSLAGLAIRQGRIAAASICGRKASFRGVQMTAVCGFFGMTVAMTGATQKTLRRAGITNYQVVYLHPDNHAAYYPEASPIHLKLMFSVPEGRILGAQAVGEEGVEKRIDVIAMAIQKQATVCDLEECELCYAPQYGAGRDPVNVAGMVAANVLRGDVKLAPWPQLGETGALILDVREPHEYAADHIDGAINMPLSQLRSRLSEFSPDREIWVSCGVGQRSYYAARILAQRGFAVRNLSGGYLTYWGWNP